MDPALEAILGKTDKRCRAQIPVPAHLREKLGNSPLESFLPEAQQGKQTSPLSSSAHEHEFKKSNLGVNTTNPGQAPPEQQKALESMKASTMESIHHQLPQLKAWKEKVRRAHSTADEAKETIEGVCARVEVLVKVTEEVRRQSDLLSSNASSLMVHKSKVEAMSSSIKTVMKYFEQVDELSKEVLHPMLNPYSARFATMLEEMSDLMNYFQRVQHYVSTKTYANKLSVAQHRAMMCLRDALSTFFTQTSADLLPNVFDSNQQDQSLSAVLVHNSNLYQEKVVDASHGAALRMLEARCGSVDSDIYLQDTLMAYKDSRVRLATPVLNQFLEGAKASDGGDSLKALTGTAVDILCEVVAEEVKIFDSVWIRDDLQSALKSVVEELGDIVYGQFRAKLLTLDTLDDLRRAVVLVKASIQSRPPALLNLIQPLTLKMCHDAQERIVFRTSIFIRNEIQNYRLIGNAVEALCPPVARGIQPKEEEVEQPIQDEEMQLPAALVTPPLPPLVNCGFVLDLLQASVAPTVFAVMAEESVTWTVGHVMKLAKVIKSQGMDFIKPKEAAALHSKLFVVHHLLALREMLAPYETQLVATDRDLDFAQLFNQRKLEITQSTREAKRDIESELKSACEFVIHELDAKLPDADKALAIPDTATTVDELKAVYDTYVQAARKVFLEINLLLTPYVTASTTRSVLTKPLKGKVYEQMDAFNSRAKEVCNDFQLSDQMDEF